METRSQRRTRIRTLAGLCTICGRNPPPASLLTCDACRSRIGKWAKTRQQQGGNGLCTTCAKPAPPGYQMCVYCRQQASRLHKRQYQERRAQGLCIWCKAPAVLGLIHCEKHRIKRCQEAMKRFHRLVELHLCVSCAQPLPDNCTETRCPDCIVKMRQRALQQRDRDLFNGFRQETLERDNFACRICSHKKHRMHVHHFRYPPQSTEDCITLCIHCHTVITGFSHCPDKARLLKVLQNLSSGLDSILAFQP